MASGSAYYRNKAICQKILNEGTGLAPERMTNKALDDRIHVHLNFLLTLVRESDPSSPPLCRAVVELDAMYTELFMRGTQLHMGL